jgi:hypothetical protein
LIIHKLISAWVVSLLRASCSWECRLLRAHSERRCPPPSRVMKARRRMSTPSSGGGILAAKTRKLIGDETGIRSATAMRAQFRR